MERDRTPRRPADVSASRMPPPAASPAGYTRDAQWPVPPPRSPQHQRPAYVIPLVGGLALLAVGVLVAATLFIVKSAGSPSVAKQPTHPAATHTATAAATATSGPDTTNPTSNGWHAVAQARFGDTQFATSDPQRGYLCGNPTSGDGQLFGVTTDGGQTWQTGASPAAYPSCNIHIATDDPLKLTLISINEPGDGQSAFVDAHYSSDGGQTWATAPIPPNTLQQGNALWSGSYLYVILPQSLQVSANGGAFAPVDLATLLPGAQNVSITSGVATSTQIYLNLNRSDCAAPCGSIVASADGGKTWTQVPNQSNIQVDYAEGSVLFGTVISNQPVFSSVLTSTDGGATWNTIALPPIGGSQQFSTFVAAPDQTIAVGTPTGAALVSDGAVNAYLFSSSPNDLLQLTGLSVDANGHPVKIWGHDDGQNTGVYWHAV